MFGLKGLFEAAKDAVTPPKKTSETVRVWLRELEDGKKREKTWRKEAKRATGIYEAADTSSATPFNILYSNTDTLWPALYGQPPRPFVERRYKDEDPLGKASCDVIQRLLEYQLDSPDPTYTPFDTLIKTAVLSALVPGRGVTRFKYEADVKEAEGGVKSETEEGVETLAHEAAEQVTYEAVCGEVVPYDRFLHGYALHWEQVPWVAFEHFLSKPELEKLFGAEIAATIPLNSIVSDDSSIDETKSRDSEDSDVKLGHVYEIWDKTSKQVLFISPEAETVLKQVDDPLELEGFFPMPKPLMFFQRITSMTPLTLYTLYEEQAKELNIITTRITKLIQALKVRGFYDNTIEGIEKVLTSEDNVLVPAENVAAMQQGQRLDNSIWLVPIEKLVAVLQQLYQQRMAIKQVIYEIMGIADILRGSTQASETATAQNLKSQWGSLRMKRMQKDVQRYILECLRLSTEIAVSQFSQETIKSMTGLRFPTQIEQEQARVAAQQLQSVGQQIPPGLTEVLSQPSWEAVLDLLRNDLQRGYRVDIETNSSVDIEATEDKQSISEFLNAMAQFMSGVAPLIQEGILPFEAAKAMLLAVTRRFRFGGQVEQELEKMKPPAPPPGSPGASPDPKMQAELAKLQLEMQTLQAESVAKLKALEMQAAVDQQRLELALAEAQRGEELAKAKHLSELHQLEVKNTKTNLDSALHEAQVIAKAQETQSASV